MHFLTILNLIESVNSPKSVFYLSFGLRRLLEKGEVVDELTPNGKCRSSLAVNVYDIS